MTYAMTADDIALGDVVTARMQKMWGWYLGGGILSVLFGFFVISYRHASVYAVIYFASAYFIAVGIFEIVGSASMAKQRWTYILFGVLWIGAGIVGFVWPHVTIFIMAVIIGWGFLLLGLFDIIGSLGHRHLPYWWAYLIRGIIAMALGFLCIRHPGTTLTTIVVMIGILAILFGVVEMIGALSARHAVKHWEEYKASLR